MLTKTNIKLGDWVEKFIAIITLGYGHSIATWVAKKMGYSTCGCETRKEWLNTLFNKKDIKL
jgi:hypothetical protein